MPYQADKNEKEILEFWEKNKTFEKSVNERPEDNPYVFYDGPPFATGLPHYGHIVASLMKDVVPRYWTMQGHRVERKWGWDCHGLPIENIVEKELDLHGRQEIVDYGVDKFNSACHKTVLKYAEEWKKTINRMGRWVDMENDYKTMDIEYMESVWWVFKQLWDKDLVYEGKKAMHICPRCVTPLSNFEVTQGYKDIKDISVTAKFKLNKDFDGIDGSVHALAWTTTPWTLPGNALLAVNPDITYVIAKFFVRQDEKGEPVYENYLLAKEIFANWNSSRKDYPEVTNYWPPFNLEGLTNEQEKELMTTPYKLAEMKGKDLVGTKYEPLFPYFAKTKNAFHIVSGDFVTTEEGTGVVHIAPAFGEDDYQVGLEEGTELIQHVKMDGTFAEEVTDFAGKKVKPKENPQEADIEIIKWLAGNNKIFSKKKYLHSYPHCWRCDTPLLNYATNSWFVRVSEIRDKLVKNNEKNTRWVPSHIKEKRFGTWLENARDWAVSRNRFWGAPLPAWKSEDGDVICVGSVKELEELIGKPVKDLHKHVVDKLVINKDGKKYHRVAEVLDCWFESGSMPYGQMHYPFENKEKFEKGFPAEFIAEGQDQTRGWFYTLHVLATALTMGEERSIPTGKMVPAFSNVIVNGIVLAEDGKKMSKRLQNYPDPMKVLETYGADAMRFYLVTSPVMHAEGLNFSESGVREVYNKVVNTLWNVLSFYEMFAKESKQPKKKSDNVLDKWIMARLNQLVKETTDRMNNYELAYASRPIQDFISDLSQWYVRRSRDRFKGDNEADKQFALATLHDVLLTLSKVMAPFTPFVSEKIYQSVKQYGSGDYKESVHLEMWPQKQKKVDEKILDEMEKTRKAVELGMSLRKEVGIRVRQPLATCAVSGVKNIKDYEQLISEELNVKEVVSSGNKKWDSREDGEIKVSMDVNITEDLKEEGLARELIRAINQMRKEQKLTINDSGTVVWDSKDKIVESVFDKHREEIAKSTRSEDIKKGKGGVEVELPGAKVALKVQKN